MNHAAHEAERDVQSVTGNCDERGKNVTDSTQIEHLTCQIVEGLGKQGTGKSEREDTDVAQDVAEELNAVIEPENSADEDRYRVAAALGDLFDYRQENQYPCRDLDPEKSALTQRLGVSRVEVRASAVAEDIPEEERPDRGDPRQIDERSDEIPLVL